LVFKVVLVHRVLQVFLVLVEPLVLLVKWELLDYRVVKV